MRTAHFDCFSGISGDMTLGAVIDAGVDAEAIRQGIASFGLPITVHIDKVKRNGMAATHVRIDAADEKKHRHLPHIEKILTSGNLSDRQRDLALRIFRRLGEAEAAVHGIPIEKVHFHEVGALDSIADIAGAAIGLDLLGVDRFTSRSVPAGSGMVQCDHGLMPIPAPATAMLLRGVPMASSEIKAELTTPTGAAILTTVVHTWTDAPAMTIERIGCGAGTKVFPEQPNVLRLLIGEQAHGQRSVGAGPEGDVVWVLETNLDDLPAEVIGYCYDLLFAAGALDVYSTPIFMKKNRPAIMLSILAPEDKLPALEEILFRETATFGVRRYPATRHKLQRKPHTVATPWGSVQGKLGWLEGRPPIFTPEYEDCARVAREQKVALRDVYAAAQRAFSNV
jgi:uncharacterized protein (TIGR00299 family) protein